jgi:hypothetical protein
VTRGPSNAGGGSAGTGATGGGGGTAGESGGAGAGGTSGASNAELTTITVDDSVTTPIAPTARGLNYWMWVPAWGDPVAGSEPNVLPLEPGFLRAGGHNNDNNTPAAFTNAELDDFVAYARAVGAEPLIQVPLLDDGTGARPTVDTAVQMVTYANVTQGHGVKYFSIGNEPDLYPDQEAGLEAYTAADYCATVEQFVPAMKAADPDIRVLGPELSWKYQPGNDWLSPILADCGEHFDIIAVHRYRIDPAQATTARAMGDAAVFRTEIADLRAKLAAADLADRPLAITETNLTWNGDPTVSTLEASPGTLPAGLWAADALGVALEQGLWTLAYWSIVEGWTLGLMTEQGMKRPAYYALQLFAQHFGTTALRATTSSPAVRAYASRNAADDTTYVIVVNWAALPQRLTIELGTTATVEVSAMSVSAVEIPDSGTLRAWTYGEAEFTEGGEIRELD